MAGLLHLLRFLRHAWSQRQRFLAIRWRWWFWLRPATGSLLGLLWSFEIILLQVVCILLSHRLKLGSNFGPKLWICTLFLGSFSAVLSSLGWVRACNFLMNKFPLFRFSSRWSSVSIKVVIMRDIKASCGFTESIILRAVSHQSLLDTLEIKLCT